MKYILILIGIVFSIHINAQIVDIPDLEFKAFLFAEGIDTNDDGEIQVSEAEIIDSLKIDNTSISSIEGIKSFKNIIALDIQLLNINRVDVSNLILLEKVKFNSAHDYNVVDLTGCTSFETIDGSVDADSINFTNCTSIEKIEANICADIIKLNNCTSLKRLIFFDCQSTDLDLEGCINLTYFEGALLSTEFTLDFTIIPALDTLLLLLNGAEMEILGAPNLKYLDLRYLNSLRIEDCPNLKNIDLLGTKKIDFLRLPELEVITIKSYQELKIEECSISQSLVLDDWKNENIIKNCPLVESLRISSDIMGDLWDFSGLSSLKSLDLRNGPNELILDGCYNLQSFSLSYTPATTYDFSDCINLMNLDLPLINLKNLIIQNGSMESLNLIIAPNLKNICVDPDEFDQVKSYLNSVLSHEVMLTTSCEYANGGQPFKLTGTSFLDINNDSCKTSDVKIPFSKYRLSDGIISDRILFTNETGQYNYNVYEGQYTYGPELLFGDYIFTTTPENRTVDFPSAGIEVEQDFCFIPNAEEVDVIEINLFPLSIARPGFDSRYLISYTNTGNVTRGGDIKLTFQDDFMDFVESDPMADVQEEGFLSWSFEDLIPYETRRIEFIMNLNNPMEVPSLSDGDILNFKAEVSPIGNQTLTAYYSHLNQEVVNSFDPNDKTCLNGNAFDQDLVGDYLKYMIRFENTGSAEAVNIVVTDTLDDSKFDARTLQVINASHDVETELVDNVVKFIFKDIYLPFEDETNDGYVTFKIKTLPTLQLGDDIQNKAEIFFDFNFPIVTNTTSTVISDFTSVYDLNQNTFDLEVSPNPASESVLIQAETEMTRIEIFDVSGRLLKGISFTSPKNTVNLPIDQLTSGIYLIRVYSENGNSVEKLIKE